MRRQFRTLSIAASVLAAAGGAASFAQARSGAVWDPSQLPETHGTVKQYTLTPRGDVDGFVLTDGTQVQLPPHLSAQTVFALRPGDKVTIKGLKAKALPLIDASSATNDATGAAVVNNGPPAPRSGDETTIAGKIVAQLHGKRGELNGAVLEDGTILRLPPPEAARLSESLEVGKVVTARGERNSTALGTWIDARALGASAEQLSDIRAPRPPKGPPDRAPPPPRG
jgi:hypothetical protein